jgi:hypothetical protein
MRRIIVLAFGGLFSVAACATSPQVQAGGEVAPAIPTSNNFLPVGTSMNVRLNETLGSRSSREGDQFTATVVNPVIAQDGSVAIPAGAVLYGHITGLHNASLPTEQGVIRLNFDNLSFNGRSYPFSGSIASVNVQNQPTNVTSSSTARSAATGAAAGAVLGAIVSGGELSKIITGGLLGAAAGTVISLGQGGGTQAVIPAGSVMEVRATQGVSLR